MRKRQVSILLGTLAIASLATADTSILDPEFAASVFHDEASMVANLIGDITTDDTITIPDGYTLNGRSNTITAVDPDGGHFLGAVVRNAGTIAHVTNLFVSAEGLANACDAGADRLRGIMFESCSGTITHCFVMGINQGASGCQEGNAIEIRNGPFDGTHPNTQFVTIEHNTVVDYQKSGIVCNGDVDVLIRYNSVGASATQENLAANSIQIGFGARGTVVQNRIDGNQWLGASNFAATAILLFQSAPGTVVSKNIIQGNADVGIFIIGDGVVVENNKVFDNGEDGPHGDFGIVNFGIDNAYSNNKVRGYDEPVFELPAGSDTKVIPGGP